MSYLSQSLLLTTSCFKCSYRTSVLNCKNKSINFTANVNLNPYINVSVAPFHTLIFQMSNVCFQLKLSLTMIKISYIQSSERKTFLITFENYLDASSKILYRKIGLNWPSFYKIINNRFGLMEPLDTE